MASALQPEAPAEAQTDAQAEVSVDVPVRGDAPASLWNPRSIALIVLAWLMLHLGSLFTPGLLDDVDSIYIESARQMLLRHDFVTPYIDGIRFFDKPPLMYWLAAGSMRLFGQNDWAARLPLALLTLALLLATYALGLRFFAGISPRTHPDRGALYATLALATCIGPYLYTRFFIPDILVCLWLVLAVHAFLAALERIALRDRIEHPEREPLVWTEVWDEETPQLEHAPTLYLPVFGNFALTFPARWLGLLGCLAFAAVTALNVLTKGLIGLVFPVGFVLAYLACTRQLRLLGKLHLLPSVLLFLAIALPWHVLAALRNPAIALPAGNGLPAQGGWAWFYLYNEHVARFISHRIPHDYGQVPVVVFWVLAALWLFPWTAFLPGAIAQQLRDLETWAPTPRNRETALALFLWAGSILLFFTFSARQEYYSLPALPALALMAGGLLARADARPNSTACRSARRGHLWLLVPLGSFAATLALFFAITAPHADPHTDIASLLAQGGEYNLSLSHIFDLTTAAMGLFRGPLVVVGLSMAVIGPVTYLLRRRGHTFAANLALAAAAACLLLAVHAGLVRFYPTLGSRALAEAIVAEQTTQPRPDDVLVIDGELTAGSSLLFYTRQPAHLVNGRINGPWYGSFWPDAPAIFETDISLRGLWLGHQRIFLLTYHPAERMADLARFAPVHVLAAAGGKSVLTNR